MTKQRYIKIGVRWDDENQNDRINAAARLGLIDYIEVNYPVTPGQKPEALGLPIYAHSSVNPLASPDPLNPKITALVAEAARRFDSPWVGEHLSWLGPEQQGRVGYIVNPVLINEVHAVAVANAVALKTIYNRPLALELGPLYSRTGTYPSEFHFLASVAETADCIVILDLAHAVASNRNLLRPDDFGWDVMVSERLVELHVAGIRSGQSGRFWHDAHDLVPESAIFDAVARIVHTAPCLAAITLEHDIKGAAAEFITCLEKLRRIVEETGR